MKRHSCSIVIPAYNEAKRLPRTLNSMLSFVKEAGWEAEIIVVNDGSIDNTSEGARQYAAANPIVVLIDNPVNRGKGNAIRDGVQRAINDIIIFADADDSTPIQDAEKLIAAIE